MLGFTWMPAEWRDVSGIVGACQFLLLVFAFFYTRKQISEAAKSRKLAATNAILDVIGGQRVRRLRGWLLNECSSDSSKLSVEDKDKIRRVAVAYDRVGYMVMQKLVPDEALYHFQKDEIEMIWGKAKNAIMEHRKNKRPHYCIHFQYLAEEWMPSMSGHRRRCKICRKIANAASAGQ